MTTAPTTRPDFRVHHPRDLDERATLLPYPGVTVTPLTYATPRGAAEPVPAVAIVDIEPGYGWPEPDVHSASREIVAVVYGQLLDEGSHEYGPYEPGTVIDAAKGSSHTPHSPTGCRLLVVFPDLIQ